MLTKLKIVGLLFLLFLNSCFWSENESDLDDNIYLLRNGNRSDRQHAVTKIILNHREEAVDIFIEELSRPEANNKIKTWAAWGLGKTNDPRAVQPLIDKLNTNDENLRKTIIDALVKLRKYSGNKLIKALRSRDEKVRSAAAQALSSFGPAEAANLIDNLKKTNQPIVKIHIIEALEKIKDPAAIEPLIDQLSSDDFDVRCVAARAIGSFGPEAAFLLNKRVSSCSKVEKQAIIEALAYCENETAAKILSYIITKEGSSSHKISAIYSIVNIPGSIAYNALIKALGDPDPDVANAAVFGLTEIATKEVFEYLRVYRLQVKNPRERAYIDEVIKELKPKFKEGARWK